MVTQPRPSASIGCLVALVAAAVTPNAVTAAEWHRSYLEPAIQAWMGMVTMLAEDGEREEMRHDRHGPAHHRERMQSPGPRHHHPMGPPRPDGPRVDALSMLRDISGRLARIERMLTTRGPGGSPAGGPGRGEWRGAGRREMSSEAREMMEARMAKMKEARKKWEQASPEERETMKRQWEARMKEGRKQMERVRKESRTRMEATQPRMEEARRRFQEMEARVKQLEAEVARLKQAAETDD